MSRILVVDDSSTVRLKIRKAVEALGHEAEVAADGVAALKMFSQADYDVVLLDIVMPELDGFGVLEAMKSSDRTKHIPVIVISALSDTMTSVVRAMELGAEDFLPKSFELALLKSRIAACIEANARRRSVTDVAIRAATPEDIPMLLSFVNTAGAGLPIEAWQRSRRDSQSPWERGSELMRDDGADIHFGNCWIAQTPSGGLGGMVLYVPPLKGSVTPLPPYAFLKPIYELEELAQGTAHVSFLCTLDSWRGQGIGTALLRHAEARRTELGLSIIVASGNNGARSLYQRFGFVEADRRPMIMHDDVHHGDDWILMFKR